MPDRVLAGSVVAVIGATGGLGRAIVQALVGREAVVISAGRTGQVDVVVDLRDAQTARTLAEYATAAHGRLDGVINAAGIVAFGDLVDTDDVVIEELFLTNAMGPMWLLKGVSPELEQTAGFFANISGIVADTPLAGMAAYCASKAAVASAMEAARREFRRRKVHVIDLRPPHTETGLATRPLAGVAPTMPTGLPPDVIAERIVRAIESNESVVTAAQFGP